MATIAITGVGGLVGRRLVQALDVHPAVSRIVGIDRRAPRGLSSAKLAFRSADVLDPDLATVLHGVDVLVHLAAQVDPSHDPDRMRRTNVEGVRTVVTAAGEAGVGRVVHLSSAFAYGAHPDNALPLTESSPLRGTPGFDLAEQQRDAERWLWSWAEQHPDVHVAVLRPAPLLGPGVESFVTRLFETPRFPAIRGHRPPWQFLHLDDLITAIVHVLDRDLAGAYNVAADGWLSFDEVMGIARLRTIEVPEEVAHSTAERAWALGLGEHPPGLVQHWMYPWVVSCEKLQDTGWQPAHSNRDALDETVAEHAGYVAVGGLRATKRSVVQAVAALVAVLGWFGIRALRRRSRRAGRG